MKHHFMKREYCLFKESMKFQSKYYIKESIMLKRKFYSFKRKFYNETENFIPLRKVSKLNKVLFKIKYYK